MTLSASQHSIRPALLIGGSGLVGSATARILRALYPDLPITIGGRDLGKAQAVANEIGKADATAIDLGRRDLDLPEDRAFGAIAIFVKDPTLNSFRYAQDKGIGHVGISTGIYELGPEVALFAHRPGSAPIVMNSTWLAGAATLPALHFAKALGTIESINIYAVLDPRDVGGPASNADFERLLIHSPQAPYLANGEWTWTDPRDEPRVVRTSAGKEIQVTPYSPFDLLSLSAATQAKSIRFDFAMEKEADSATDISTEIVIEIAGKTASGEKSTIRRTLIHPQGQAPVTATGVAVAIERLLGLAGGPPPAPGLYFPELLIEPGLLVERLERFGMRIGG